MAENTAIAQQKRGVVIPTGFEPVAYSLGNCRSILLSYGTIAGGIAGFFASRIPVQSRFLACCAALFFSVLLFFVAPARASDLACEPVGALPTRITHIEPDGVIRLEGQISARLAGIIWPDALETKSREALIRTLDQALLGQTLSWKPAAVPDRWGIVAVQLFVAEPGAASPFWLQAGLVEAGHVLVWPDGLGAECLRRLEQHENHAITLRRGVWAARAQTARIADLEADPPRHAGRKISLLIDVASVRPWRALHFVNRAGDEARRGAKRRIGIAIPNRVVSDLTKEGDNPRDWGGSRVLFRLVVPPEGLPRMRLEARERVRRIGPSPNARTTEPPSRL